MAIIGISKILVPGSSPGVPANNIFYRGPRHLERSKKTALYKDCFLLFMNLHLSLT